MTYPTPTKRRRNSVDHSRAENTLHHRVQAKPKPSRATKRFERKVMHVLNGATPTGKYTHTSTLYMPIVNDNKPTVIDTDMGDITSIATTEQKLSFFTPRQFKDAEGVLFNNKTPTYASWDTTTVADPVVSGTNCPTANVVKVNYSSVSFHFKNHSNRQITLEMYICYGKGPGTTPRADIQTAFQTNGQIRVVDGGGASANTEYFGNFGINLEHIPAVSEKWDIKRIDWEFEPGEEAWHIMRGPCGYQMDGSKKNLGSSLTAPDWMTPSDQGAGCYVVFRYAADISLFSTSTGAYASIPQPYGTTPTKERVSVARGGDKLTGGGGDYVGGIACVIQRHYNIELPEGFVPSKPINSYVVWNGYGNPTGTIKETNMDEDQPATVPPNEL